MKTKGNINLFLTFICLIDHIRCSYLRVFRCKQVLSEYLVINKGLTRDITERGMLREIVFFFDFGNPEQLVFGAGTGNVRLFSTTKYFLSSISKAKTDILKKYCD